MNLQGEPPSHKHGNTWEGTRDPCEGMNQATAKARVQAQLRRKVRSEGILRDMGKRRQN